jgi:tRNA-dihydrouridine synthase
MQSGADGLMVARGAVVFPWLCADIAREIYGYTEVSQEICKEKIYFDFVRALEERFPPERRVGRLKSFTSYFAGSFTYGHQLFKAVQASTTMKEAREAAAHFFSAVEPASSSTCLYRGTS